MDKALGSSRPLASERSARERQAYDDKQVGPINGSWHARFGHIFECPNTIRHLALFDQMLARHAAGRTVLEIGCASGELSQQLLAAKPVSVYGIDISVGHISDAKNREIEGQLEFSLSDVSKGVEGTYGLIFGRSILHHLDFRPVLERLYRENLTPDGTMIFLEPLGSNPLIRLYHLMSKEGHTPDERPLVRKDLFWLKRRFPESEVMPANLLSFIVGVPSTFLLSKPDNLALRLADRADSWMAAKVLFLAPYFRFAIILIRKKHD
jgi:SAM-dependent methyltransferase